MPLAQKNNYPDSSYPHLTILTSIVKKQLTWVVANYNWIAFRVKIIDGKEDPVEY